MTSSFEPEMTGEVDVEHTGNVGIDLDSFDVSGVSVRCDMERWDDPASCDMLEVFEIEDENLVYSREKSALQAWWDTLWQTRVGQILIGVSPF